MKSIFKPLVVLSTLMVSGLAFAAGDAAAGKETHSKFCAACHGEQGKSKNDIWPNLAGQKEAYLFKQLQSFKDGARSDPVMSPNASMLSEQDMRNLAAYYKSLTP